MDIFQKCGEWTAAKEAIEEGFYPYFIPLTENEEQLLLTVVIN